MTPTTEEVLARPHRIDATRQGDWVMDSIEEPFLHYDKEGRPISLRQWVKLHDCVEYSRIGSDEIGPYWVSTVWLGIDHAFLGGPPLIFETMVFASEPTWHEGFEFQGVEHPGYWAKEDFDQRRYSTLEQALAGHAGMVEEVRLFADLRPPEEE